jgi:methylphosphotriester-DNA--protein-cysteine methyltransferase
MIKHNDTNTATLKKLFHQRSITLAGNRKLKIYGTMTCSSGKRMKKMNRVFFSTETDALTNGYRPCAHCLKAFYNSWKIAQEAG